MAHLDPGVLAWASAVLGSEVTAVRSLRLGGSPWLLRTGGRDVVLRVAGAQRAREAETEVAAMTRAARAAIVSPEFSPTAMTIRAGAFPSASMSGS